MLILNYQFTKKYNKIQKSACNLSEAMLWYLSQRVRADKYGRLVKGLRRRPLTAETGVRFPYLLLKTQEQIVPEFFCARFAAEVLAFLF